MARKKPEKSTSRTQNLYTGRSGQLAVMAQFLSRGYNVAMPEIDIGEDIFVVRDADGNLSRIQVKSAIGKGKNVAAGAFKVPMVQLHKPHTPELDYVFAIHRDGLWREFVVIPRKNLESLHDVEGVGNVAQGHLLLYFSFTDLEVQCSKTSLQQYRGDWSKWPVIPH